MTEYGIYELASMKDIPRHQILFWKEAGIIKLNENGKIDEEQANNIDEAFMNLYRFAYYKDIQDFFACSKEIARSLWKNNIIKEYKKDFYRGYEYPIFIWKDILDKKDEILQYIEKNSKATSKKVTKCMDKFKEFEIYLKRLLKDAPEDIKGLSQKEKELFYVIENLNEIKRKLTFFATKDFVSKTDKLIDLAKTEIKKQQIMILGLINEQYNAEIRYENISQKNLYTYGILESLQKGNYLGKILSDLMIKMLPVHPKDEYTEARKMKRKFIIHAGLTNTGKTYEALEELKKSPNGVYLAPLRLLALEVSQKLNSDGIPCSLITGEEENIIPNARHFASTIEMIDINNRYDIAVIDEVQMISDSQRGSAWSRAIFGVLADKIHICCSPDAVSMLTKIIQDCGDSYEIKNHKREIPLEIDERNFNFPKSIEKGDALIVFSKKMVLRVASALADKNIKASVIYGNLPPHTRRKQVESFLNGETDVVVATDAIGMGLNLPIKRVVFMDTWKFDGVNQRELNASEVKQIAGRAGRKNMYDLGYVNSIKSKKIIRKLLAQDFEELQTAYIKPLDSFILNFPVGTLKERLLAWSKLDRNISYFKNTDLRNALNLLDTLETHFGDELSIAEQYKLIFLPFDYKEEDLKRLWMQYIDFHIIKKPIRKPELHGNKLDDYEIYYKRLDFYYSFCKAFDYTIDSEWLMEEKMKTSNNIHYLLLEKIKEMGNKCKYCKKPLPWDYVYNMCEKCHDENYRRYRNWDDDDDYY